MDDDSSVAGGWGEYEVLNKKVDTKSGTYTHTKRGRDRERARERVT